MLIDFRQLFPKYNIKPKGVLHVGANVCEEAPVYNELGIKNVLWIEANKKLFDNKKIPWAIHPYSGQVAINACISDVDGELVKFHISNNGSQSSSILELGTHKIVHPDVYFVEDVEMKTERLDSILNDYSKEFNNDLDFLNIDLQGAELKALKGMGDLLNQFKWAYLEVNKAELYKGCALVEEIDMYLLGYGFKRVETMWAGNTNWGDALYIKKEFL